MTSGSLGAKKRQQTRESIEAQLQSVVEEEEKESGDSHDGEGARRTAPKKPNRAPADELLFGVLPKDLALPAAIGFLGVAVLAAVAITRAGSAR